MNLWQKIKSIFKTSYNLGRAKKRRRLPESWEELTPEQKEEFEKFRKRIQRGVK